MGFYSFSIGYINIVSFFNIQYSNKYQMSGNKNVADYTNFDERPNKRVKPPGGVSNLNLGWSNQPTDYGPKRAIKLSRQKYADTQPSQQQRYNYSEPMKVMQMPPTYNGYGNQNYPNQYDNNRMGGERGYDYNKPTLDQPMMGGGYGQPDPRQGYNNYGNYKDNQLYDQIDIVKGSAKGNRPPTDPKIDKYQRPPSVPRTQSTQLQGKPSIRLNGGPKDNNIFNYDGYNNWKDPQNNFKVGQSDKSIPQNQHYQDRPNQYQYQQNSQKNIGKVQKTSVKVNNPPGGKQNFTLG